MKIERTKKTIQGSFWGMLEKLTRLIFPYLLRTIVLRRLGTDYLGLNGLFNSILQVLSLTELGFGLAVVYCMYKPIAENDDETVCGIVTYLKKIYQIIGIIMMIAGLIVLPFVPKLIKGEIPDGLNVYFLYMLYLVNTAVSYFLFAYKQSLLSALQCNDMICQAGFITSLWLYVTQIIILYTVNDFYLYTIVIPISTVLKNLSVSYLVDKNFKQLTRKAEISDELKKEIKAKIFPLMSVKISSVLTLSIDTLVITALISLEMNAKYNNYYYILNGVLGIMNVFYNSMQAGIGNMLVLDNRDKVIGDFRKFFFINVWLSTVAAACLLCLYQPFIEWSYNKDMVMEIGVVILFVAYFYLSVLKKIVEVYKDAAGLWREDMYRCYGANILNIILSIATARSLGVYGVIGASVLSTLLSLPLLDYVLFKHFFHTSPYRYYLEEIKAVIIACFVCGVCYLICTYLPGGIFGVMIRGVVVVIVSLVLLYICYHRDKQYKIARNWLVGKIRRFVKTG